MEAGLMKIMLLKWKQYIKLILYFATNCPATNCPGTHANAVA